MIMWSSSEISRLHLFLGRAQSHGISDVHINPALAACAIRVRHQGQMLNVQDLSVDNGRSLIQRIKAQAQLNLAETRMPQDGRIEANPPHHREVRVACHPTLYGENIVIRLFAPQPLRRLSQLGIGPETAKRLSQGLETEEGLILVCGPTGAGKTSTLHALLNEIGHAGLNIMTLEDPVEITLAGALQTDLSQLPKMTFAQGLKSLLRQDPDIMLVGEIRDRETAELAVEAAMTGHLVLASLHAADTQGALSRLDLLGLPPVRVLPHLRNLVCQRLVRNQRTAQRVPLMQIWSPPPCSSATPSEPLSPARSCSPYSVNASAAGDHRPAHNLWRFNDSLQEALQIGLLAPEDRPGWIREDA